MTPPAARGAPRLLLLLPSLTYRADAFVAAARRLGARLVVASDCGATLESRQPGGLITLDFRDPAACAARVAALHRETPIDAVVGVDDDSAVIAAEIATAIGLPGNPPAAVRAARDKEEQRRLLSAAGVAVPHFAGYDIDADPSAIAARAPYPCVIKPVALSASRGVMRADGPDEFVTAHRRLARILAMPDVVERGAVAARRYLVEAFVPGVEVALEGLLVDGRLHVLALFDKPDPLDGPFFEETIYLTPSRLDADAQGLSVDLAQQATGALGLTTGPVHIELRHTAGGAWLIELAARPIGGRCGGALRFDAGHSMMFEELLLAHALRILPSVPPRERGASGVMMIPTPRGGVLRAVGGLDAVRRIPGITDAVITAHRGQTLVPLPEGSRYLGFLFARGEEPEQVEAALRAAHARLVIEIDDVQAPASRAT